MSQRGKQWLKSRAKREGDVVIPKSEDIGITEGLAGAGILHRLLNPDTRERTGKYKLSWKGYKWLKGKARS